MITLQFANSALFSCNEPRLLHLHVSAAQHIDDLWESSALLCSADEKLVQKAATIISSDPHRDSALDHIAKMRCENSGSAAWMGNQRISARTSLKGECTGLHVLLLLRCSLTEMPHTGNAKSIRLLQILEMV